MKYHFDRAQEKAEEILKECLKNGWNETEIEFLVNRLAEENKISRTVKKIDYSASI